MSEATQNRAEIRKETFADVANRQIAVELMIKAIAAKPDLISGRTSGSDAANELIAGAKDLLAFILEG
jgi:hypothetical protein